MKSLFGLLLVGILGWLTLSACSPTDNLAKGDAVKSPTAASEATQSTSVRVPQMVGAEGGLYPPQDISLVASTGKPQFLDSYADW